MLKLARFLGYSSLMPILIGIFVCYNCTNLKNKGGFGINFNE